MRRRGSAQARAWAELPERWRRQCLAVTADAGYGALSICAASLLALSTTMVGACGAGTGLASKIIAKHASPLIAR